MPVRFRYHLSDVIAVPSRDVRPIRDRQEAREVARAMLEQRATADRFAADSQRREDALVEALVAKDMLLVRVEQRPRTLQAPQTVELSTLAEPMDGVVEPPRPTAWIGLEIVDQRGRPLPWFRVEVSGPSGKTHSPALDPTATTSVDVLDEDGSCRVLLSPTPMEGGA